MPQISNLNVQVNQNQVNSNQVGVGGGIESGARIAQDLAAIRTGTLVEGRVLSLNRDGSYTVRLEGQGGRAAQTLTARSTLPLIVGEHFRAVWDAKGADGVPVLRLSASELSVLSRLPMADRELATALLSRGLPLSDEVMMAVRDAWKRMGGLPDQVSPILELWARAAPMTGDNVQLLTWYSALDRNAAGGLWERIRREIRERTRKGENPIDVIKNLKERDDEGGRFLKAHSLLLRPPRDECNPLLLSGIFWPSDEDQPLTAKVFSGKAHDVNGKRYWQVGFGVEGSRLGFIGGSVESDGRACNLNLYAESSATCELLKYKRHAVRKELEGQPLVLQSINISRSVIVCQMYQPYD